MGNGVVLLRDGEAVIQRPFAAPPSESEFRLEVSNFRCFQGTLEKEKRTGSFCYIRTDDLKLLDDDSTILFRKTPRQLKVTCQCKALMQVVGCLLFSFGSKHTKGGCFYQ